MTDEFLIEDSEYNRILFEYKKYGSLVIGYDFDNTVYDFHQKGFTYDKVIKLLQDLKELGCTCICWTANNDYSLIQEYCADHNIPCDGINSEGIKLGYTSRKPFFSALLDDRAGLFFVYNYLNKLVKTIKNENK